MEEYTYSLKQPERIHLADDQGNVHLGLDQDWYPSFWKRMAGCGPTVATTMILYLSKAHGIDLPFTVNSKTESIRLMESIWHHVTPSAKGVHLLEQMTDGVLGFAQVNGFRLDSISLAIPKKRSDRPELSSVIRFISEGLQADCPVAFLNLSNGKVKNLDAWHWVTVVALDADERHPGMLIYDGAKSLVIDLNLWLETTTRGGGFVYFKMI